MFKSLFYVAVLSVFNMGLAQAEESAQSKDAHWRLSLSLQSRLNPVGLSLVPELGYRTPLSTSNHLLLRDTYLEVGLITPTSPASFHPGAYMTIVPIAPIVLRVSAHQLRYFGLFGNLGVFEGVDADWSDDTRDDGITDGEHGTGYRADASATLRIKLGRVVASSKYTHAWFGADIPKDRSWYESTEDLLMARTDQMQKVDSTLGAFVTGDPQAKSFFLAAGHWQGYWTEETDVHRQIASALLVWRPGIWSARKFTIIALLGTYLEDEYRSGGFYYGGVLKISWDRLSGKSPTP